MAVRTGGKAPYAPPATVLGLIHSYRHRGLATPFNAEVLTRAGVKDGLVVRTLQTLRLLDLIDEQGNPSDEMEGLRRVAESEFKQRLEAVVRAAYAEVFQYVDPAEDDAAKVKDAFRHFEPIGQLPRMVTLFLGLCEAGAIIPENARAAAGQQARAAGRRAKGATKGKQNKGRPSTKTSTTQNGDSGTIPLPLSGLLASLPSEGEDWTQKQRDRFVSTFTTVLDFVVTIRKPSAAVPDDEDDG